MGYALTASVSFVAVLFLTTRWLKDVDGRLRTLRRDIARIETRISQLRRKAA